MSISKNELTLDEAVGQLFLIGINGTEFSDRAAAIVNEIRPGGICLFARNIKSREQVRQLNIDISKACRINPILTLDEEGGLVDRLKRIMTPLPSASRSIDAETTAVTAMFIGETLRMLGFNMDLAPVVDVIDEKRRGHANGLVSRTYGNSVDDVILHSRAFLDGLSEFGIAGCLKHFPGLGASTVDSHEELPIVSSSDDELSTIDLEPFRTLATDQNTAIMVGHAAYPNTRFHALDTDGNPLPASLNPRLIDGLLRDEMQFDGLIMTDDLEMGAIIRNYGIGDACVMSLKAGVDMLAICADEANVFEGVRAVKLAVERGDISPERLDRSTQRILAYKSQLSSPIELDLDRLDEICREIERLN